MIPQVSGSEIPCQVVIGRAPTVPRSGRGRGKARAGRREREGIARGSDGAVSSIPLNRSRPEAPFPPRTGADLGPKEEECSPSRAFRR